MHLVNIKVITLSFDQRKPYSTNNAEANIKNLFAYRFYFQTPCIGGEKNKSTCISHS